MSKNLFVNDIEKSKGEIIICNDSNNPSIYIMTNDGSVTKISGGNSGGGSSSISTAIPESITVSGWDSGIGNYTNNQTIPAGTEIHEILENILSKELYPTNVTTQFGTATTSMNELTMSLDKNGTIEVGTLVTLTNGKTNGTKLTTKSSMISGMDYGYTYELGSKDIINEKFIEKSCTTELIDNNYTISATINSGFNQDTTTNIVKTPETKTGNGSASLDNTVLGCVVEGDNKITINATGASYSYSCGNINKVYYCSNIGNTDANKFNNGVSAITGTASKPTISTSATVTGKYKYFLGYSQNTSFEQFDSESVRALDVKTNWITKDSVTTILDANTTIKSNGQSIVIACPEKYVLSSITNGVGANIMSNFSSVGTIPVETGNITTDYTVYVYPITNNVEVEFKNVSLNKA